MRATLKDVAKLAGVSTKTVSNVINGYAYLRPETRARVERAIEQLNYRPNVTARNLRRGSTNLIAFALPEIRNPYFSELAQHVVEEARRHGLTVLIDCTEGIYEREKLVVHGLPDHVIDGLILLPHVLQAEDLQQRRQDETPLVMLGERVAGYADCVTIDSRAAAYAATEHLVSLGRRRIGVIGGSDSCAVIQQRRMDGYRGALETAGMRPDPDLVAAPAPAYTSAAGAAAVHNLLDLDEPADAVFCHNDLLALGAMRTILARGLRVPEDVAVIGIDDIDAGSFSSPTLSTIAPDKAYIARTAVRMLVERFAPEGEGPPRQVTAGFRILPRESTVGMPR